MLTINELTVFYGKRKVLDRVTLEVRAGEVLALIGPNGAGKTTLVRAVSGVIQVQGGRVYADGQDLLSLPSMRRARLLAVVPQAVSMPPAFTAWETTLLGRTPYLNFLGHASEKDEEISRRALQKADALDLSDRRVGELSGGEQQRVLLARALAQSTPILLLDEPTVHLDLQHQIRLMEIIRQQVRASNLAVLIALHDLNLAARYADRVVLLVAGEIRAMGEPRQVFTREIISAAYQTPVQVVAHPFLDVPLVLPEPPEPMESD